MNIYQMVEAVGGEGEVTELRVSLVGGYRDEAGTSQQVGTQYLHTMYSVTTHYVLSNYTLSKHYLHSIYTVKYLYNIYTGWGHHPPSDGRARARAEVSAGYLHNLYISKQYLHKI